MNKAFLTGLKGLFLTSLVTAQTMAKSPASVPAANKAVVQASFNHWVAGNGQLAWEQIALLLSMN